MDPASPAAADLPSDAGRCLRPWGWFETLARGDGYLVKRLLIEAGRRISRQRHQHRSEHWVVVSGTGTIELDDQLLDAAAGTSVFIPLGGIHRASAATGGLEIIEVQRGLQLSEEDIERFDDDYGRVVISLNSL